MTEISIVGAGIIGLAHAYAYARRGHRVRVYDRSPQAEGASIRNFGMIWPIGQPAGQRLDIAMRGRSLWLTVLRDAELPYHPDGSLHLAYFEDEEALAREFATREPQRAQWLSRADTLARSNAVQPDGLRGALFSSSEVVVDARLTLARLPTFLHERYGVTFHWSHAVRHVADLPGDRVLICSGHDFETLYPEVFADSGLTRCKLQMLRTIPQPDGWRLGPALAGGLTMRFYSSFAQCAALAPLRRRFDETMPEYGRWGIHVMASQTADGAITLGDSHEYGPSPSVFNKDEIDNLILAYLQQFAHFPQMRIAERWHGIYAKHPEKPYCVFEPEPAVRIVTGLGGAGMTLSFGLADILYEA
ncbi:MAG: TIGR03364 family FAD-dependent oxidoreductase [Bryobacterales bacterium]|nr:TIGR03364 family FAD-dependent oxidoreductase [Bryobacterales bacterium]